MKYLKLISLVAAISLLLCGCNQNKSGENSVTSSGSQSSNAGTPADADFSVSDEDMFTSRDTETAYDASKSVEIKLNGSSVSCNSDAVKISGSTVTITDEGTFIISGTLTNGMIIVNAGENDKPQIILHGASVTSETSSPLYIYEADKVFVTLADGTDNSLVNGGSFEAIDESNIDAAVFSKQDLTFNGTGSLTVSSPAGHGIVCKDDLVLAGGSYTVNSANHGLDANDSIRITDSDLKIDAGKDGIHCENSDDTSLGYVYISSGSFDIEAEGDGISAYVSAQIEGGSFNILAGGGYQNGDSHSSGNYGGFMGGGRPRQQSSSSSAASDDGTSMKGIKASGSILISNGIFRIDSADDGIHANVSVIINGGSFDIATGDDGIHADEDLTITAGDISITKSYEGLEATNIAVSGGNITLISEDDGLNAAGGTDSSGSGGRDNGMFGGGPGGMGSMASSNGSIVISGGELHINASGDGIDANGYLKITGGYTVVVGPTQGDTATLDYDTSAVISGGTFIGTGASGMAQTFSDSENQGVIAVSAGVQSQGTPIKLTDSSGKTVISHTPELSYSVVILSSPDITKGTTYTLSIGSVSKEFEAS